MFSTADCLAPGNTPVPDVTLGDWRVTDVSVPESNSGGWIIHGWDLDHTEYGRKATAEEWAIMVKQRW